MSEQNTTPTPKSLDRLQLMAQAGKLNYTLEQTLGIVCSHFPGENKNTLRQLLSTVGTLEYEAYHTGKSIRLFDVENSLYVAATSGEVDAQEALLKLQVDKDVATAIREHFFPDDTNESDTANPI